MKIQLTLLAIALLTVACNSNKELPTVKEVDLNRYQGTWYEIARLPNRFEKDLECVTATYTLNNNGTIKVLNQGINLTDGMQKETATGKAKVPDTQHPGRLKVSFFGPFYGDYYIIDLDNNYQYALVGDPSRKYLWILSRTSSLPESVFNKLVSKANELEFATDQLHITRHNCN
ncbi:lipocalin family protein [Carboxylicivirga linearis]|uniref:Lipocalin family protein n=1 Tax=Carboxylicivirga linearis TaxID=1628157 RepID=A0ABS5JYG3_9BACT|nr:lipocalin family protein [Carboxylicivirga linearis]MBS2099955.1 lipocalin family protein [Carboxylicivirga linearis]